MINYNQSLCTEPFVIVKSMHKKMDALLEWYKEFLCVDESMYETTLTERKKDGSSSWYLYFKNKCKNIDDFRVRIEIPERYRIVDNVFYQKLDYALLTLIMDEYMSMAGKYIKHEIECKKEMETILNNVLGQNSFILNGMNKVYGLWEIIERKDEDPYYELIDAYLTPKGFDEMIL